MGRLLDSGNVVHAAEHVMSVYEEPLRIYCLGCSLRWVGEPRDLVAGFFADRLTRPAFLDRWRESGRPLRFWLIVGFKHYLLEEARRIKRDRDRGSEPAPALDPEGTAPDHAFDRRCAVELVRRAVTDTEAVCTEAGLGEHWAVFTAFYLHGRSLEEIASAHGIDTARAAVMKRTAVHRFRATLRELVSWAGAADDQIDAEVMTLMEALS